MTEKELKKLYPELFGEGVERRHQEAVSKNPDLHKGKAVKFDGRLEHEETTYPEFRLHNATNSMRYIPVDKMDDLEKEGLRRKSPY